MSCRKAGSTKHCQTNSDVKDNESIPKDIIAKTFRLNGYPTLRSLLLNRGWVDLAEIKANKDQQQNNGVKIPTFYWGFRRDINFKKLKAHQIVNHYPTVMFTTKVGLCQCLQRLHKFDDLDADNFFPRCHKLQFKHEYSAFIEDYYLTVCLSIIKWVLDYVQNKSMKIRETEVNIVIPHKAIEVILGHCELFLKLKTKANIGKTEVNDSLITDSDWKFLLGWYYQLMNYKVNIEKSQQLYRPCANLLTRMMHHWPQLGIDGKHNLWIVKPAARSRGEGIRILHKLEDILPSPDQKNPFNGVNYVVQKYIERPLLIEGTKFDIRQWFLVTSFDPVTIYFYLDCYVRFCSKPFSLHDLSEAAHLCNNAIQCRYVKTRSTSSIIPNELMWSLDQLKEYFKNQRKFDVWDKWIFPGMKNAIIATVLSAQHSTFRKNCFQLFGADFMISEDYHPWLLEINSDPCMAPTTTVTARLCANLLDDMLKVILDRRENPECSIGKFNCIYRQMPIPNEEFLSAGLKQQGISISKPTLNPLNDYKTMLQEPRHFPSPAAKKPREAGIKDGLRIEGTSMPIGISRRNTIVKRKIGRNTRRR